MLDGYDDIKNEFPEDCPPRDQVIYAYFDELWYEESYRIIWQDEEGLWWEAEDGHCSCNGFGPFDPKPVTKEYVDMQFKHLRGDS